MKITKEEEKILNKRFNIYEDEFDYELEDWTNGGVNMIIYIDKRKKENLKEQLLEYIDNFDIDEVIDLYRQDERYRNDFTIRESLKDFEDWIKSMEILLEELEEL